ncbi:MAG: PucR family transcriptional regulator [Sciscionella sp.]
MSSTAMTSPTPIDARRLDSADAPHDEAEHDPLTLARLRQERVLRTARVISGDEPSDRAVTWCLAWQEAVGDGASLEGILVYCRADQLDEAGLRALSRRGVAALVVAGDPDESVFAEVLPNLLVLVLASHVGYREISQLVAELSLARETHALRYGLTVHRSLAELLYRGAGLDALCHQLARLTRAAVAILDPQCRMLTFAQAQEQRLDQDALVAALRADLPDVTDRLSGHGHSAESAVAGTFEVAGTRMFRIAHPIVLGGRHDGWVVVVEPAATPHPHDIAEHRVVVEQAVTIVGTEMLRMRGIEAAQERARGDFVHALLHGRFANHHDLQARSVHYDFPTGGSFGVLVASGLGPAGAPDSISALFALAREVGRIAPVPGVGTLATVVGDVLAVIRQVDPASAGDAADAGNSALAEYAHALEREFQRRVQHPVAVAYGRPVCGADRIFDSYREARITLSLRQRLGLETACGFHDLRVYATLAELATSQRGRGFAEDLLTPLRANRAGAGDLEQSVLAYISCGGNVNAAARELHIHRNTMLYKLERASRLLHLDLRQAEHRFALWLAYKLDMLAEMTAAVDRDVRPT